MAKKSKQSPPKHIKVKDLHKYKQKSGQRNLTEFFATRTPNVSSSVIPNSGKFVTSIKHRFFF